MAKKPKTKKKTTNEEKAAAVPASQKPEGILLRELILSQNRHWEIADGTKAEPGRWYRSKRKCLVLLDELKDDGSVVGISHVTGNKVSVPPEQVIYFTPDEDPGTPCGTILVTGEDAENATSTNGGGGSSHFEMYDKYSHIIPGSIYKVQNVSGTDGIPAWERKRKGKKISIKGQVRCKIRCQEPGCNNERDIKVQDAFQVKKCEACRDKKKKKNLEKFLDKKASK